MWSLRARLASVAVTAAALAASMAMALPASAAGMLAGRATAPRPATPPAAVRGAKAPAPAAPSQSPAAARRDGVVPALAKLPFSVRVSIKAAIRAPEGVWVISRPTAAATKKGQGCRLGPETGKYPTETICTTEYGEVLLLNASRTSIIRAYPLPSVPPKFLRLTKSAVYCGRQGSTTLNEYALPDSMVCRIDRKTFQARVHVYAAREGSEVLQPCFYPPRNWTVTKGTLAMSDLQVDAHGLWAKAPNGTWTLLDPVTLAVVRHGVRR